MHFRSIVNSFVNRNGPPVYLLTGKLRSRTESFKTSKQQLCHSPHNTGVTHLQHLHRSIKLCKYKRLSRELPLYHLLFQQHCSIIMIAVLHKAF